MHRLVQILSDRIPPLGDYLHARREVEVLKTLDTDWAAFQSRAAQGTAPVSDEAVICLTSYPPRFESLHLTLKSLLVQSLALPIELWIAEEDVPLLPPQVTELLSDRLKVRPCRDLKSYKKIIPSLEDGHTRPIIIADDDCYYWPSWAEELVNIGRDHAGTIICHRAHRVTYDENGRISPYDDWEFETSAVGPDPRLFPTGIGGVLYPPGAFKSEVLDEATFTSLSPHADDIWLWWMASLNRTPIRRTTFAAQIHTWRHTQAVALWRGNVKSGGNNAQIRAMEERFGPLFPTESP